MKTTLYRISKEYLHGMLPDAIKQMDLEKYYVGDSIGANSLKDIYIQIIHSAQNYQRMPNVIKFGERQNQIGEILCQFDYRKIKEFQAEDIYKAFRKKFKVTTEDSKRNSWYKWSCSVIDAAAFVDGFKNINDFRNFVECFSYNAATRISLPLLISTRIKGIGFALACDMLKELGYLDYPKPDVHMMDICESLGLSSREPIDVFECMVKAAEEGGVTPYKLDKILWLISSGNFYMDEVKIAGQKWQFIERAKQKLQV